MWLMPEDLDVTLLQSCLSKAGSETERIYGESREELKREAGCGMASLGYNSLTLMGGEGEKGKDWKDEMYNRKTKVGEATWQVK